MGVTPLEGLPMGTRCGSIDPTIVSIIAGIEGDIPAAKATDILNKQSGMIGVSGVSSDFRDIESAAGIAGGDVNYRAKLALDVFCYNVAKFIGSYVVAMGGLDAVAFTAGVGENSANSRKGICRHLVGLGVSINEGLNDVRSDDEVVDLTGNGSKAKVFKIATNEELVIARDTMAIV